MKQNVVSIDVDVLDLDSAVAEVLGQIQRGKSGYVCVANVHMSMLAYDSEAFRDVVDGSFLTLADGMPLSFVQRRLGHPAALQVRGQDIMLSLCRSSVREQLTIGFYGGKTEANLRESIDALRSSEGDIDVGFAYSPPFRELSEEEDEEIVRRINEAGVKILFVGIGCPKQERWMWQHRYKLNCVMIGVGAAFDFVAGSQPTAPRWMQRGYLEWLFRLAVEPRRLWKRYLYNNPRFIALAFSQYVRYRLGYSQ